MSTPNTSADHRARGASPAGPAAAPVIRWETLPTTPMRPRARPLRSLLGLARALLVTALLLLLSFWAWA